jgi:serine protease AprX
MLAVIGLVSPAIGVNPAAAAALAVTLDANLPVQPYLQYGARVNPMHRVKVIVRKATPLVDSNVSAALVGSSVLEEFPLIQSFELELPVSLVATLSRLPGVQYVSYDGPVRGTAVDTSNLQTTYEASADVPQVWNAAAPSTGRGVTVAVIDTGVNASHPDLVGRITAVSVNPRATSAGDGEGHGTHVIGTIAGRDPQGWYIGVAPDASVVSVKVSDDAGNSNESDLIRGLAWVYSNRSAYHIRAVNISAHALTSSTYLTSPVDAAVEALWQAGVVVVVAAGNEGSARAAMWHAPGNDPFVITVGALDDNQTAGHDDDTLASFSSRGRTVEGTAKPDVVAPGRKIVAPLAATDAVLARLFPNRISADGQHIRLSGTSMATPVVTGEVAILLQRYPNLTPDQVKWLVLNTTRTYSGQSDSAGAISVLSAIQRAGQVWVGQANQGLTPSPGNLLAPVVGLVAQPLALANAYWDSAAWDSAAWDSASWDSASWDSAAWDSASWDAATPD